MAGGARRQVQRPTAPLAARRSTHHAHGVAQRGVCIAHKEGSVLQHLMLHCRLQLNASLQCSGHQTLQQAGVRAGVKGFMCWVGG